MHEMSKANARRQQDSRYRERWFVGRGIDIGCGPDKMDASLWPQVTEVIGYDQVLGDKDARFLPEITDNTFDFAVSSHCLEHMDNVKSTLTNWMRIIKPGGFLVVTIPEELMYESGQWPSRCNSDHKASFSLRAIPIIPSSINVTNLLWKMNVDVELVSLLTEHWDQNKIGRGDQTLGLAECAIEFVVRKRNPQKAY